MIFLWERKKAENDVREMIFRAFPEYLFHDVETVIQSVSHDLFPNGKALEYNKRMGEEEKHGFILENGERVSVPYRLWLTDPGDRPDLPPVQQTVLHCICSRSTDGYVREKHIKAVLEHEIPYWTFPFILKLSDEYIPEILEIIYDRLKDRDTGGIQAFCRENPSYFVYSHARMISYWDCFWRDRWYRYDDYVGKKLYHECFGYTRGLEKQYDRSRLQEYRPILPSDPHPF